MWIKMVQSLQTARLLILEWNETFFLLVGEAAEALTQDFGALQDVDEGVLIDVIEN